MSTKYGRRKKSSRNFCEKEKTYYSSMTFEAQNKRAVTLVCDKYKNANVNGKDGKERGTRGCDRKPARRQQRCA